MSASTASNAGRLPWTSESRAILIEGAPSLSTRRWSPWSADLLKASGIGTLLSAAGAAATVALVRRFPGRWWIPAGLGASGLGTVFTFAAPVLLDPIFNHYTPLPDGELRSEVIELADRAGVKVREVYR